MAKCFVFTPPKAGSAILTSTIHPNADGCTILIPWSGDVNPSNGGWETSSGSASGGYNFTHFDSLINAQIGYGAKSVVVVLGPITFGGHNSWTPNYVFTSGWASSLGAPQLYCGAGADYPGAGTIPIGTCAQGVDNTAFPVAFQTPFVTAWKNAVIAAINHMKAASYASKIAYVRVGGGSGGEWNAHATDALITQCSPATMAGLLTTWVSGYMSTIQSAILAQNTGFTFCQSCDGGFGPNGLTYAFPTAEAVLAQTNGFGLGDEGLQGSDIKFFGVHGTTSGGNNYAGYPTMNHAYTYSQYPTAPVLQFQTSAASDPTGVNSPGSLVPLIPYALARGGTSLELYYQDWQVAYDPSSPYYATYGGAYRQVIQSARTVTPPTPAPLPFPLNFLPPVVARWLREL